MNEESPVVDQELAKYSSEVIKDAPLLIAECVQELIHKVKEASCKTSSARRDLQALLCIDCEIYDSAGNTAADTAAAAWHDALFLADDIDPCSDVDLQVKKVIELSRKTEKYAMLAISLLNAEELKYKDESYKIIQN